MTHLPLSDIQANMNRKKALVDRAEEELAECKTRLASEKKALETELDNYVQAFEATRGGLIGNIVSFQRNPHKGRQARVVAVKAQLWGNEIRRQYIAQLVLKSGELGKSKIFLDNKNESGYDLRLQGEHIGDLKP